MRISDWSSDVCSSDLVSLVGFVIDGVHYSGGCTTRRGAYPSCESLVVPSYSTAKSAFAGLAMMRLEATHPGTFDPVIGAHVPACAAPRNWGDGTCGNPRAMATRNHPPAGPMGSRGA